MKKILLTLVVILLAAIIISSCGDNAIQSSGFTPTSTPPPDLTYQLNDLITIRNSQIIVKNINYTSDNLPPGYKRAHIFFDLQTAEESLNFDTNSFCSSATSKTGVEYYPRTSPRNLTERNKWTSIEAVCDIPENEEIYLMYTQDPIEGLPYKIKVILM